VNLVTASGQRSPQSFGETFFDVQLVGRPLLVKARCSQRFIRRFSEIEHVD
jgi:hypothetical protein